MANEKATQKKRVNTIAFYSNFIFRVSVKLKKKNILTSCGKYVLFRPVELVYSRNDCPILGINKKKHSYQIPPKRKCFFALSVFLFCLI